jgi:hypothetical protein
MMTLQAKHIQYISTVCLAALAKACLYISLSAKRMR